MDGGRLPSEAVEQMRSDLRAIQDVAASRLAGGRAGESEDSAGSDAQHRSVADGLLSRAEKITEMGIQETLQSVLRNLELRLTRFVDTVAQVEQAVQSTQQEAEAGVSELRASLLQTDTRLGDTSATLAKCKARATTQEDAVRSHGLAIETLQASVDQTQRLLKTRHEHHDSSLRAVEERLRKICEVQQEQDAKLAAVVARLDEIEGKGLPRIGAVEAKVEELDRYNVEFMELSKRSTSSFESEMDTRLASLDTRYAALLKHYHASVMSQVAGAQESLESKQRALHASVDSEVTRLSDEVTACAAQTQAHSEKAAHDSKTLNRRLLQGLRLLKDHHANLGVAGDRADQHPQHPQQQQQQQQQPLHGVRSPATSFAHAPMGLNFDLPLNTSGGSGSGFTTPVAARGGVPQRGSAAAAQHLMSGGGGGGGGVTGIQHHPEAVHALPVSRGGEGMVSPSSAVRRAQAQRERAADSSAGRALLPGGGGGGGGGGGPTAQVDEFLRGLEQIAGTAGV